MNAHSASSSPDDAPAPGAAQEVPYRDPFSTWKLLLLALCAAVVIFLLSALLDGLLVREKESLRTAVELSDTLGGVIAGVLVFRILLYERERRARLRHRLQTIADMNHHVRNALQVISLSAFSTADQAQLTAIREGVNRIQWALSEILPKM